MIAWTDEAIEAAHKAYWAAEESPTEINEMRAALDAAVKAQGKNCVELEAITEAISHGRVLGRAEALEEAARVAWLHGDEVCVCRSMTQRRQRLLQTAWQ